MKLHKYTESIKYGGNSTGSFSIGFSSILKQTYILSLNSPGDLGIIHYFKNNGLSVQMPSGQICNSYLTSKENFNEESRN